MSTVRAVTVIQPTITRLSGNIMSVPARKRVAAYARVSTDNEEQLTSYEAQVDYYTRHIRSHAEWEFVEIYTDEGISATSTKNRDGFKRMVSDALSGKIDMIITKSVSRFARNTVDSLTTVRQLKEKGVEVYFEKENIYTLDSKGELLITIMSSLAQEESRSISENVTWGQRKRFADGKVSMPYKRFLGYEKGENGFPRIVEKEAGTVRLIYKLFLEGNTPSGIARHLTEQGVPTPSGKVKWQSSTVESILSNEKYKGDAILQKTFTVDFLTKKMKINEGEVPQYYVENSHPAIIAPEVFDLVRYEMKKRKSIGYTSHASCFSGKIICGECGSFFGSKVWHSTNIYRRTIWQCNSKFKNEEKCRTPHLDEDTIKRLFVSAVNKFLTNRDEILAHFETVRQALFDTAALDAEHTELQRETAVVAEMIQKCVGENTHVAQSQDVYCQRYEGLVGRFEIVKHRFGEVDDLLSEIKARHDKVEAFIDSLRKQDGLISEFDEHLWHGLVDYATVYSEDDVRFIFRNELVIQAHEEKAR